MTLTYYPTIPRPSVEWYRYARHVTHVPSIAIWWPGKYAPTQISHFVSSRRTPAHPRSQFAARQMVAIRRYFFVNTTEGLIVMTFKLCQEGNWEPLIERIVFHKWIV